MRSLRTLVSFLFLLGVILSVQATLSLNIIDPSRTGHTAKTDTDIKHLQKAANAANEQLDNMHKVVDDHENPYHHAILTKAFGPQYDIEAIKDNVQRLRNGQVDVETVRGDLGKGVNAKSKGGILHFDHKYYTQKTDRQRAGTFIHESAHSILGAHDFFTNEKNAQPISSKVAKDLGKDQKLEGYITPFKPGADYKPEDHHYAILKETSPHAMLHNADSYKALGHLSTYGLFAPMDPKGGHTQLMGNKGIQNPHNFVPGQVKLRKALPPLPKANTNPHGFDLEEAKMLKLRKVPKKAALPSGSKSPEMSPDAKVQLYNSIVQGAKANKKVIAQGDRARNSRVRRPGPGGSQPATQSPMSPDARVQVYSNLVQSTNAHKDVIAQGEHARNSRARRLGPGGSQPARAPRPSGDGHSASSSRSQTPVSNKRRPSALSRRPFIAKRPSVFSKGLTNTKRPAGSGKYSTSSKKPSSRASKESASTKRPTGSGIKQPIGAAKRMSVVRRPAVHVVGKRPVAAKRLGVAKQPSTQVKPHKREFDY